MRAMNWWLMVGWWIRWLYQQLCEEDRFKHYTGSNVLHAQLWTSLNLHAAGSVAHCRHFAGHTNAEVMVEIVDYDADDDLNDSVVSQSTTPVAAEVLVSLWWGCRKIIDILVNMTCSQPPGSRRIFLYALSWTVLQHLKCVFVCTV